jgi:quercetin dioxygenase-like cupin family protein
MVEEARLEELPSGLAPATEGWFVVNVRDAAWETGPFGAACFFESEAVPFADLGINLRVLSPGSKMLYHAESNQEDFLVLVGECLLLIEGKEWPLRAWDFVHCPPGTEHGFAATEASPCVIVMTGARAGGWPEKGLFYPRSELALRYGVGVERETSSPRAAQAGLPQWQYGRPDAWDRLPWA